MSAEQLLFENAWENAGQRVASLIDGVSAVAVIGDDPVAIRAVANGVARAQALHRRVFLAHLLPEAETATTDDQPGISDMVRYGVSLGRAAVTSTESPNLYHLYPGAEGAFAPDILSSRRWFSLSEQVHKAGALLLVSAPAGVPDLASLLTQLDGALTVGETTAPAGVKCLGEVHTGATLRTTSLASVPPEVPARQGPLLRWGIVAAAALALLLAVPQVRSRIGLGGDPVQAAFDSVVAPTLTSLPDVAPRVTSDAAWVAELRFLNSRSDAQALVTTLGDSLPGATFAPVKMPGDSATWYHVVLGAFSDSVSAENFLAALRTRGVVPSAGGGVTHTPFALLVDSALDNAMARVKVAGYHGRQLPAYALRDSAAVWRIYVGAFAAGADAASFKHDLDSLNIQSTLVVRVGSTS
ncbi:MAG: hypothetical protein IPK85_15745 [Gemmatimonadetes bacterium]|nr:hypothetical protein [Gemmatimonadota bacterium]